MLKINNINLYYGGIHALKDLSLEVKKGEIVTLIGANGAGKTSTLRAISGLEPIKSGTITYNGSDLKKVPAHKIVSLGLSHVPEGRKIFAFGGVDDEELDVNDFRECPDFVRLPSEEECEHARKNLENAEGKVDYIVTYDAGFKMRGFLEMESNCFNNLHAFLNEVSTTCKFEKWFFGCFHLDRRIPPFYYAVYENIYNSETGKEL